MNKKAILHGIVALGSLAFVCGIVYMAVYYRDLHNEWIYYTALFPFIVNCVLFIQSAKMFLESVITPYFKVITVNGKYIYGYEIQLIGGHLLNIKHDEVVHLIEKRDVKEVLVINAQGIDRISIDKFIKDFPKE
jgi:hypothetical protein